LLNHGDAIQLTPHISLAFQSQVCNSDDELDPIVEADTKQFATQYLMTKRILGTGGYATIFVAIKQSTRQQVACKVVSLPENASHPPSVHEALDVSQPRERKARLVRKHDSLAREYDVLKSLDHPNIIRLEKVFYATYNMYIVQELITSGDLLSYLDHKGPLLEAQAAVIVRQILEAVIYLHDNNIVHRDIKPENILMTSWKDGARIVLTDFGQSRTLPGAKSDFDNSAIFRMQSVVGTKGYTAP